MKRSEKIIIALLVALVLGVAVLDWAILWRGVEVDVEMVAE